MSTLRRVFSSSVGTKFLLGLTGLALFAYLVLHLAGNLLILAGPATFNEYSHALISNPLILPIELGLLAIFLLHVYKAVTNFFVNRSARPESYAVKKQDRALFTRLLDEVLAMSDGAIAEVEPETRFEKEKARELKAKADELF